MINRLVILTALFICLSCASIKFSDYYEANSSTGKKYTFDLKAKRYSEIDDNRTVKSGKIKIIDLDDQRMLLVTRNLVMQRKTSISGDTIFSGYINYGNEIFDVTIDISEKIKFRKTYLNKLDETIEVGDFVKVTKPSGNRR